MLGPKKSLGLERFLLRRHKQTPIELGEIFPNFSFHPFLAPAVWKIAQTSYLIVTLSHESCVKLTIGKKIVIRILTIIILIFKY